MQKWQISIPEPCHENWQQMTATDQGRFCNACVKEVIDFSMLTDVEMLNYFNTRSYEKVCGRALPSQLNRTLSSSKEPKKKTFWYGHYMLLFFMFFAKAKPSKAQEQIEVNSKIKQNSMGMDSIVKALTNDVVSGIKRADNKMDTIHKNRIGQTPLSLVELPDVTEAVQPVYIIDGLISTTADHISAEDIEDKIFLQAQKAVALIGAAGRHGAILMTTRKTKVKNLDTVIVSSKNDYYGQQMGGFSIGVKVTGFSDAKASLITLLTDSIQVYPNPVKRNNPFSVTIKLKQLGKHQIQIITAAGKIVLQKQVTATTKNVTEKIGTDNSWASGIYYICVFDEQFKLISKKSFIFQ